MYVVSVLSDNQSDDDVIEIGDEVVMQHKKRKKEKQSRHERSLERASPVALDGLTHKSRKFTRILCFFL